MRITGGMIRGRRLARIKGSNIRPTSDMIRGSIFDILGQTLTDCKILDLFAGTGSLGIESLSRGGKQAVFIDKSRSAVAMIKKNLALCGYEPVSKIMKEELPNGLARIQDLGCGPFDLVFIDPPYGKGYIRPTIYQLVDRDLVARGCRIVVESSTSAHDPLPSKVHTLRLELTRSYGSTVIGFYSNRED